MKVMGSGFDDVERILDQHARRLAGQLGGLLVDLGEALRRQAETAEPAQPRRTGKARAAAASQSGTATRSDLLREAGNLGIAGRSKMSKADLERAIRERRSASGAA